MGWSLALTTIQTAAVDTGSKEEEAMGRIAISVVPDREGLHAFMDVGDAWYNERNPFVVNDQLIGNANRALQSFGAGIHINLLSWQLRFEAAKERDGDWEFEFMDVFNF